MLGGRFFGKFIGADEMGEIAGEFDSFVEIVQQPCGEAEVVGHRVSVCLDLDVDACVGADLVPTQEGGGQWFRIKPVDLGAQHHPICPDSLCIGYGRTYCVVVGDESEYCCAQAASGEKRHELLGGRCLTCTQIYGKARKSRSCDAFDLFCERPTISDRGEVFHRPEGLVHKQVGGIQHVETAGSLIGLSGRPSRSHATALPACASM
ncbi:Uncharacterised protein [Mycobacteroides abscessus subsp. abscessus]|nr:Uncharacterised protein [Mycobacteroides abscessus subsp. abscessus]